MNKKVLALALAGIFVLSGCGAQKVQEESEDLVKETVAESDISKEEVSESVDLEENLSEEDTLKIAFEEALLTNNIVELREFIKGNSEKADQDFLDSMIVQYDEMLHRELGNITSKYGEGKYITAVMQARDENYEFDINLIKDEAIKEELEGILDSGFYYENEEGEFYLRVDEIKLFEIFNDLMSEKIKSYYDLRDQELKNPTFIEDTIGVEFSTAYERAMTMETFIRNYPDYYDKDRIKFMMMGYIDSLTRIDCIDGGVDEKTGQVNPELLKIYKEILESDYKILSKVIKDVDGILQPLDYKIDPTDHSINSQIYELKNSYFENFESLRNLY